MPSIVVTFFQNSGTVGQVGRNWNYVTCRDTHTNTKQVAEFLYVKWAENGTNVGCVQFTAVAVCVAVVLCMSKYLRQGICVVISLL
jgi:hypothetical protein